MAPVCVLYCRSRFSFFRPTILASSFFFVSYRNGLFYLGSKTRVLELCNQFGGRVIVCPEWNGRVMTSTCDGLDGGSFGLINVKAIDSEEVDDSFAFYGGEDQLTLSPEGGPFSLYYATIADDKFSGPPELLAMPTGYREGAFSVDSLPQDPEVRMRRALKMTNLAGMQFDLDLVRTVHLLAPREISGAFGDAVAVTLEQADVNYVAFSCSNTMINRGAAHSKLSGLISLRLRSMFNSGQNTIAVIPYRRGSDEELGPAVCTDFSAPPRTDVSACCPRRRCSGPTANTAARWASRAAVPCPASVRSISGKAR